MTSKFEDNLIVQLTFQFSLLIIDYTEMLESRGKKNLAWQLFDAGTLIGANVNESQNAEIKADFIHKMKITAKEEKNLRIGCVYVNIRNLIRIAIHS